MIKIITLIKVPFHENFTTQSFLEQSAFLPPNGAFSQKVDFVTIFKEILNLEGHPNRISGSKVTVILSEWMDCSLSSSFFFFISSTQD